MARSNFPGIRWLRAAVLAGLLSISLGGGAASAQRANVDHTRSAFASASSISTTCAPGEGGSLCLDTYVSAARYSDSEDMVCTSFISYVEFPDGGRETTDYEFGCYFGPGDAVAFDGQLSSVTVAPVNVQLNRSVCDETGCTFIQTRVIPVSAVFSGFGPVNATNRNDRTEWGSCTYTFHGHIKERAAGVSVTLDGAVSASSGTIYRSANAMTIRCD